MAEPSVKYATTSDGVGIAFADTGGDGRPVLFMRGSPFTHVQLEWKQQSHRFWFGEIFASNVVRELVAGRGFLSSDRGERALRGFENPVTVYEVSWRE